ncbi:beta-phosphoglucomutase [Anaerolineae bacterium CFX9]|nr:beta-phosphoglucomutase [Kamptonema cortianum]MDL1901230.1 beta-phosphoglucomutase [Anaerolineae bacterium CFX9]
MALDIRALIFDLDGVITDTAELHYRAWKQLADEERIPFTREDNEQLRGVSRRESLNRILRGRPIDEPTAQAWMARKNAYYLEFLKGITPADILPGVVDFLTSARSRGLKLALGSASRNAREVLERLDILSLFDVIGDGHSVVNSKPAPDLFLWAAGGLGVNPAHAVVFEDAEAGIDAALAGGFWTVGIGSANVGHAHILAPGGLAELTVDLLLEKLSLAAG